MINTKTLLHIDNVLIDTRNYYDLQVYSAINDHLPILTFKLRDDTGLYWSSLDFSIGSTVIVTYIDTDSEDNSVIGYNTTKFIISSLYDGFEVNNVATMGGFVQVTCTQAWTFYGDSLPHAYNCQKIGDLVKSICRNVRSEAGLVVNDENFMTTSDSGSIKYKTMSSDLEFIVQKLLPVTMVDSSNALFYVNKAGVVHLTGFNTAYAKSEKAIICPDISGTPAASGALSALKESKNLDVHMEYLSISSSIAPNPNVIGQLKQKTYIYDLQNESTKIGIQSPSMTVGKDAGKLKKAYTPIKNTIIDNVTSTSNFYIANRPFEEQIALSRNMLISTNNLLSVEVYVATFMPNVNIGDTVFLWIPPAQMVKGDAETASGAAELTEDRKTHWLVGKWLISSEAVMTVAQGSVAVRYTLIRPSFSIEPEKTSLSDVKSFFKVKG